MGGASGTKQWLVSNLQANVRQLRQCAAEEAATYEQQEDDEQQQQEEDDMPRVVELPTFNATRCPVTTRTNHAALLDANALLRRVASKVSGANAAATALLREGMRSGCGVLIFVCDQTSTPVVKSFEQRKRDTKHCQQVSAAAPPPSPLFV